MPNGEGVAPPICRFQADFALKCAKILMTKVEAANSARIVAFVPDIDKKTPTGALIG